MRELIDKVSVHPAIQKISEELISGAKKIWISGLTATSRRLFIACLAQKLNFPVLIAAADTEKAEIIFQDMSDIFGEKALYYPVWGLHTGKTSPESETLQERLKLFERIISKKWPDVIVMPAGALEEKMPAKENLDRYFILLKRGMRLDTEKFILKLAGMDYRREDMVADKGEFSLRGEVIDIFPPNFTSPLRIIMEFDRIASLRFFSVASQRSIEEAESTHILPAEDPVKKEGASGCEAKNRINFYDYFKDEYFFVYEEPAEIFKNVSFPDISARGTIFMSSLDEAIPSMKDLTPHRIKTHSTQMLRGKIDEAMKEITKWQAGGYNIYLSCNNSGEEKRLKEILEENKIVMEPGIKTVISRLTSGFIIPEIKLAFIRDEEIFNRYEKKLVRRIQTGIPLSGLFELNRGDYLVHVNYGIGRYLGLQHMKIDNEESDFLSIGYRDGARLYVPVEGFDLVQKYIGMEEGASGHRRTPPLSRLGSRLWSKTKEKTQKAIKDMASEVLKLEAQRQAFQGFAFSKDSGWQKEFEDAFIYEETPGQKKTVQEIKTDMESPYPMDRLICGDVGYGKTEVAMRAAFKTIMDNRQVACLVPTTLLAYQHYNTFSERMADYPVTIACLSRFESKASQKKIVEELREGKVDIVIGTHRLLQKDIAFKNLGLVIIDEEQRFGVVDKEKVKKISRLADCITLSATPIPRTLYMGLAGFRSISFINTPPEERLPVETVVINFEKGIIRSAILRELERGGQSFVVHNRIDTIYSFSNMIREIAPEARIAIVHGEMTSNELEEVMMKFLKKDIDVLVATTIIASGLDIPNANTIIIDDAHTFGLADLYQLRGRVGRFRHRSYAFFIIPKFRTLTEDARKRLKAIEDFAELGAGFKLALRDLEIRGAGNLLGREQHGFIAAVGFDLYCQLLQKIVSELKGEKAEEPYRVTFEVGVDFSFSPEYIPGINQRLDVYRRMALLKTSGQVKEFENELTDRFGKLPDRAKKVIESLELKARAGRLGIIYAGLRGGKLILKFSPGSRLNVENLDKIDEDIRKRLNFGEDFTVSIKTKSCGDNVSLIREVIENLESSRLIDKEA